MKFKTYFLLLIFTTTILFNQENSENNIIESEAKVTIHAEDTHLPTILSMLAKQSDYNIVTGPNVQTQEKLTIHLDDVPISQAINLVIRAAGLSYEIIGNSILVANKAKLSSDIGVQPHIIPLEYASADLVANLLKNITESITIDKTGNNILVSASPKKIDEIEKIVLEIDKPAIQVMLEARLIEVSLKEEQEFGIDWEKLSNISIIFAEAGTPIAYGPDGTSAPISGSMLPGFTNEFNESESETGIPAWVLTEYDGTAFQQIPDNMPWMRGSDQIGKFGRQLTAFDVTLDMLMKDNQADVLTNSQVVTLNGHVATIDMVDQVPYLAQSGGQAGNMQVFKEIVGIRLKILPTVNSDGYITTEVTPEVSSIVDWTAQGYPWTKKRSSTTTVRVKDGETIVIAGLVTNETLTTESKFPLLWRLPWIGRKFFTHTLEEDKKTDLIIQVRPSIVMDNYSGIEKQHYHNQAEKKLDVNVEAPYSTDSESND